MIHPCEYSTSDNAFHDLARSNLLLAGDILSYSAILDTTTDSPQSVVFDTFLFDITSTPKHTSLTFLLPPTTDTHNFSLPPALVLPRQGLKHFTEIEIPDTNPPLSQCIVRTSVELERVLASRLPHHLNARSSPSDISHLKSWKVYRWDTAFERDILPMFADPDSDLNPDDYAESFGSKGGRTIVTTLFYLRHIAARK